MKIESRIEVSPRTGVIIGSVILLIAVLIAAFKADALMTGYRSKNWTKTTGILDEAKYWTTRSSRSGGRSSFTYHGQYRYSFTVDGQSYQGTNFNVAGHMHTGLKGKATRVKSSFTEGSEVPVFYNPSDPKQCVLEAGIAEDTQVALMFVGFFGIVGVIVLQYQMRRLKNV